MGFSAATASPLAPATPTSSAPARPGPAVTAIASMSLSVTPASARARFMVGTNASRWARLATSGTTPPKRACWSTLEASASASRVWPRTMPTPVSSQLVSMPRTSGSSRILELHLHHDGVGVARLVVPAPDPDRLEAELAIEQLRGLVGGGHLEQHVLAVLPPRLGDQHLEQPRAGPLPLRVAPHRQVVDPCLALDDSQTAVADDGAVVLGRDQVVVAVGQLVPEHPG